MQISYGGTAYEYTCDREWVWLKKIMLGYLKDHMVYWENFIGKELIRKQNYEEI